MSPNNNKLNTIPTYPTIGTNYENDGTSMIMPNVTNEERSSENLVQQRRNQLEPHNFNNTIGATTTSMMVGGNDNGTLLTMDSIPLNTDLFAASLPSLSSTTTSSLSSLLLSANHTRLSKPACACTTSSSGGDKNCCCLFPLFGKQEHPPRGHRRRLIDMIDEAIRIVDDCPLEVLWDGNVTDEAVENNYSTATMNSARSGGNDNTDVSLLYKRRKLPQ